MPEEIAVLTPGSSAPAAQRNRPAYGVSYSLAALLVAAAAVLAFVAQQQAPRADVSLIFVLPVVISAAAFGWGPALAAGVAGVLAFDFFFLAPRFTLQVAEAADVLSLALLLIIAAIVSTVAAQARRSALETAAAKDRTLALASFAEIAGVAASEDERLAAAAAALSRVFRAPAVIYARRGRVLAPAATAGDPALGDAEQSAAQWVLGARIHARGETYPHDVSKLDLWPLGADLVAGVDFGRAAQPRPETADALVRLVAALVRGAA